MDSPGAAAAEPFVPAGAGGLLSVMGLAADDRTGRLWAFSSNLGVGARPSNQSPALKVFDLATGAPLGSFPLPGEGLCNDLAVGPDGAVYVTDSRNPRLLRLPPGGSRLEEWLRDERFAGDGTNLNGIAFTGPRPLFVDKSNSGDLFRIDLDAANRPEAVTAVALSRPLSGPDGLHAHDAATLLAVEAAGTLVRIVLEDDRGTVTVLRDGFRQPSAVALYGDSAWVIEAQYDSLSRPPAGPPILPFQLYRVPLD